MKEPNGGCILKCTIARSRSDLHLEKTWVSSKDSPVQLDCSAQELMQAQEAHTWKQSTLESLRETSRNMASNDSSDTQKRGRIKLSE